MIDRPVRSIALFCVTALLCLVLFPVSGWADYYTQAVDIQAQVMPDGALRVSETRTLAFDDDVNGMYWVLPLGQNQQGKTSDISDLSVLVQEDGTNAEFEHVARADNGDKGVFTLEHTDADGTDALRVKVYNPCSDGDEAKITVSYTLSGAVMNWSDTAELYWKFVGPGWDEGSDNVSVAVSFAASANSGVVARSGSTLRAWGHGTLEGEVAVDDTESNPTVTFSVPVVAPGEFAEARILFPSAWVPGLLAEKDARVKDVLAEEQRWADEANAQREEARMSQRVASTTIVAVGAGVLVLAIALRCTKYKHIQTTFSDRYFRDVPSADHPAVIAAFMKHASVEKEAFVATLMKLTDERVIGIVKKEEEHGSLGKKKPAYRLRLIERFAPGRPGIDGDALRMFFRDGEEEASIESMKEYASSHTQEYKELNDNFKASVQAELEVRHLLASKAPKVGIMILAGLAMAAFVVAGFKFQVLHSVGIGIVLGATSMIVASTFETDTKEGAELRARCKALKSWLEDFTRLGEAVPEDVVLWNKLLVMGVALGVSEYVLRDLARLVPTPTDGDPLDYYPIHWWLYPHYGHDKSPMSGADKAYASSVAAIAASASSSGSGVGGGFSGGGGGGVGGGGGGSF